MSDGFEIDKPKRGRPRKDENRRRRTGRAMHGRRLGVNEAILDFDNFVYHWLNDEPGRLMSKTLQDDWNVVDQSGGSIKEDSTDLGNAVSVIVGTHPDGSPKRAYLCRKRTDFYEQDKAEAQARLDEQLSQLRRGHDAKGAAQSDYVPDGMISIAR